MKITSFLLIFIISMLTVFSQSKNTLIYADNPITIIIFENNENITITSIDSTTISGVFTNLIINKVPYIRVTYNNNSIETFLFLSNDTVCFLYKANNQKPYVSGFSNSLYNRGEFIFDRPSNIRASSSLVENRLEHSPEKINQNIEEAWAEGVPGYGINEKLYINPPMHCTGLYISIGFISFERPFLYEENSRPKKISVSVENKFSIIIELEDTPNYQTITFPQAINTIDTMTIEILDVYQGTKYQDTCINNILYDTIDISESIINGYNNEVSTMNNYNESSDVINNHDVENSKLKNNINLLPEKQNNNIFNIKKYYLWLILFLVIISIYIIIKLKSKRN